MGEMNFITMNLDGHEPKWASSTQMVRTSSIPLVFFSVTQNDKHQR